MARTFNPNVYDLLKNDPTRIYVTAEAGLSHGGSKERALTLVRAAKWAGADAVKFQAFQSQPTYQELAKKRVPPYDAFRALFKEAKRLCIDFLSTPIDEETADFLDELGVSAFRMAEGDITNRPLIEHISRKGKPVMLSTGLSAGDQIEKAIGWMHMQSNAQAILLHGVSSFPAPMEELHLKSVEHLRERFGLPVGFSDRSVGSLGATVAVSLGAQVIERHFLIETHRESADLEAAMDAKQLKRHIEELRTISQILGTRGTSAANAESRNNMSVLSVPAPTIGFGTVRPGQIAGRPAL